MLLSMRAACRVLIVSMYINTLLVLRAWWIMLIFLILCYASNAHLLNIYASRICTIMLNTVVAIKKTKTTLLFLALTVTLSLYSSNIELAESASVDLEPVYVTSSGQRSLLDVLKPASKSDLSRNKKSENL